MERSGGLSGASRASCQGASSRAVAKANSAVSSDPQWESRAAQKTVGKPCAGKPHAGIERGMGNQGRYAAPAPLTTNEQQREGVAGPRPRRRRPRGACLQSRSGHLEGRGYHQVGPRDVRRLGRRRTHASDRGSTGDIAALPRRGGGRGVLLQESAAGRSDVGAVGDLHLPLGPEPPPAGHRRDRHRHVGRPDEHGDLPPVAGA